VIKYFDNTDNISYKQLSGFFVGWKSPLTAEQHYKLLCDSTHFIVAVDDETDQVVGFVTALCDGVNSSFIPLLEVLPSYQGKGIGTKLMEEILLRLNDIPNVDLTCDIELQPFYKRFNMLKSNGMILRKF
jgi:ribosomal protein S18 acetylase RimI-like enzyme